MNIPVKFSVLRLALLMAGLVTGSGAQAFSQPWNSAGWVGGKFGELGVDATIYSGAVFNSGLGPELYVGGDFLYAGGDLNHGIAKWSNEAWGPPFGTSLGGTVRALLPLGPLLYVGGDIGVPTVGIVAWNGVAFVGVAGGVAGRVNAIVSRVEAGIPVLYVAGAFTAAGGVPAANIARYDTVTFTWSALGSGVTNVGGIDGEILTLELVSLGGVPSLVAGGSFDLAGGAPASNIAVWNFPGWSQLGNGLSGSVLSLEVYDDELYAGGGFTFSPPVTKGVARLEGGTWSPVGDEPAVAARALCAFDDGVSGEQLYAVGGFFLPGMPLTGIARWDGSEWSSVGDNLTTNVGAALPTSLFVYDDPGTPDGPELYAGGGILGSGSSTAGRLMRWNGVSWRAVGGAVAGEVNTLVSDSDGDLYAGGFFSHAGGSRVNNVARFDGSRWHQLGSGVEGTVNAAFAGSLADGSDSVYFGGQFTFAGGIPAQNVARWNSVDETWSVFTNGIPGTVYALGSYSLPGEELPSLYAGGVDGVFRLVGNTWVSIGDPLGSGIVYSFLPYLGYLYAAGQAAAGSDTAVMKWKGGAWTSVGSLNGTVRCLWPYMDPAGNGALYAGGTMNIPYVNLARWNGSAWSAPTHPIIGEVRSMIGVNLAAGGTPLLLLGGHFNLSMAGLSFNFVAYDTVNWTSFGIGPYDGPGVNTIAIRDVPLPELFAGGWFDSGSAASSFNIARNTMTLNPANPIFATNVLPLLGDVNNDGVINGADIAAFVALVQNPGAGNPANADFNNDGVVDRFDIPGFLNFLLQ